MREMKLSDICETIIFCRTVNSLEGRIRELEGKLKTIGTH